MADEDKWPDGMLPVRASLRAPGSFGKSAILNVDGQELLHVPVQRDDAPLAGFIERAVRAINSFDDLVEACEAAIPLLESLDASDFEEMALLRAALAAAKKQGA